ATPADQLIDEEEHEAFETQLLEVGQEVGPEVAEVVEDESVTDVPASTAAEDVDLIRLYLRQIGRRKLLTAAEEREIGRKIEDARADLLGTLAEMPQGRATLLALAAQIKDGKAL